MSTMSEAKVLGGVGSILILLMPVPSVGWILAIIGLIMTLIAIKYLSDLTGDKKIYGNMIYSVVLAVAAIVVVFITVMGAAYKILGMGSFVGSNFVLNPNLQPNDWIGFFLAVIPGLLGVWALLIASAVFIRRSYVSIAEHTNVRMFDTAALIYLIGAITAVILIGFLLILVAEILFAVSFFSLDERSAEYRPMQPPEKAV